MAQDGYMRGRDASYIKPKFVPDTYLRPRDDSGGLGFHPHSGEWDDGGVVTGGAKSYLSAMGGEPSDHDGHQSERDSDKGPDHNEQKVKARGPRPSKED